jgi:hypothetical protein
MSGQFWRSSGFLICRRFLHRRASTSVWTGFVFGLSHPTSTAGSGSQKADETTEADLFIAFLLGCWSLLGSEERGNDLSPAYKGKERDAFQESRETRSILRYLR